MSDGFMSVNTDVGAGRAFLRSLYRQYADWGVDFGRSTMKPNLISIATMLHHSKSRKKIIVFYAIDEISANEFPFQKNLSK
jgi:hypothetical protein